MAVYYGQDTDCLYDLPLIDVQVSEPLILIGQRIARRLTTTAGALSIINDTPNFGHDVRQYINRKMTPGDIVAAQQQIQAEILRDEEVEAASVQVSLNNGELKIRCTLNTSAGPFQFVLAVGQLTTSLIFNGIS